eukprot:TRINITY_DN4094_c0_g2_i2.p1 TRINITY_DN4094_c0_g2~~TRINITY_DN4094_c0_g2_i2.p1  ORF type:complete len:1040 (+),score=362.07 TRINITY_DN4094_c0_g2_i2:125-3244(+)
MTLRSSGSTFLRRHAATVLFAVALCCAVWIFVDVEVRAFVIGGAGFGKAPNKFLGQEQSHAQEAAAGSAGASTAGTVAAAGAAAAVAAFAALKRSFKKVVPFRKASQINVVSTNQASGAGYMAASSSAMSSSSSSFMGSSLAGSVTQVAPSRGASAATSMTMMFERFNEKAIKVCMNATEESRRLGHNYVGTEMLLIGIIAGASTGICAKKFKELGINLKDARKAVEDLIGRGDEQIGKDIPFTPAAKRILEASLKEASELGSSAVDPVHLLLAMVKSTDGTATKIFEKLGIDVANLPKEILAELQEKSAAEERELVGVSTKGGGQKQSGKMLEEFGKDLTRAAANGEVDPLVGREEEIDRVVQILARRQKNNPVLIGEPGVGKTAITEGLAYRIATGDIPEMLRGKRIVLLDLGMILSGTKYRGEFEERLKNIVKEAKEDKDGVILMIDEIHTLVGAGGSGGGGGAMDAANILKPALSRGELQVIGATTTEEYRKYVEKDKALERRFQPVQVAEPTVEQTVSILRGLARKYEAHHKLRYSEEALVACVKLASQYICDRFLPDKAIDVLDETGARVSLRQLATIPEECKELRTELREVQAKKDQAVCLQDFATAAELRAKELELQKKVAEMLATAGVTDTSGETPATTTETASEDGKESSEESSDIEKSFEPLVCESDVAGVVSTWTGVPVDKVSADESMRLVNLEDTLHKRVIGQEEAVVAVSKAVRRARAGLKNPNRPIASFIFCGPTGVGKTELCKALSASYFGKEDAMIRLDMSEFMERHTVSKLIGSPPGYVGYDEESQLTDGVRRRPYSLVLFDEVEKAHPDVFNLCLQILEDGRLTDSKGRTVSFKNTLIIMTSNVGAKAIEKQLVGGGDLGFSGMEDDEEASSYGRLKTAVHSELKNFFRPEFLNRLDEIIVFKSLTLPEVGEIAEIEFKKTFERCVERGITLSLTDRFKKMVVKEGFNPVYGARPLRRAITRLLEDQLSESFLNEPTVEGEYVLCDLDKNDQVIVLRQQLKPAEDGEESDSEPVKELEAA